MHLSTELLYASSWDQTLISCWLYGKIGVGMWMMCLGGLGGRSGELGCWGAGESDEVGLRSDGEEVEQSWEEKQRDGDMAVFSGENALSSDKSDGDGVVGGVSMDGIGWSLKQADS